MDVSFELKQHISWEGNFGQWVYVGHSESGHSESLHNLLICVQKCTLTGMMGCYKLLGNSSFTPPKIIIL